MKKEKGNIPKSSWEKHKIFNPFKEIK